MQRISFLDDMYSVDENGVVYSHKRNRYLTARKNTAGYFAYMINKKWRFAHRLVAITFIPNPYNKPQVNHKDGDKLNNHVSNLEWVTGSENAIHAYKNRLSNRSGEKNSMAKIPDAEIENIRSLVAIGQKQKTIARQYNVNPSTISKIVNFKRR